MQYYIILMRNIDTFCTSLLLFFTSCNFSNLSKVDKQKLFQQRIQEIQTNGLDLYPQISPCNSLSEKKCFQQQLITELHKGLTNWKVESKIKENDTIWIYTTVRKDSLLILNTIKNSSNHILREQIETIFKNLSPIKPATINGIIVNSSYKVPLIFKPY